MKKIIVVDGSPRPVGISNTFKALTAEVNHFKKKYPDLIVEYFKLPIDMKGCIDCPTCRTFCNQKGDVFASIVEALSTADAMLLGSPVYLDMPTPQTVAFLTRLSCMSENTDRKFFEGKEAYLLATAYCSGTKTCIHTMMGACEMLGFTIPPRGSREYIRLWHDEKLRGGLDRDDAIYLKEDTDTK